MKDSRPGPVLLTPLPFPLRSTHSLAVPKPAMKTMEETLILLSARPSQVLLPRNFLQDLQAQTEDPVAAMGLGLRGATARG